MCGIAGAYFRADGDAERAVRAICARMYTRGPDAEGIWHDPSIRVCLGHRRLSIIDPDPRANQPFLSEDGRYAIVFNGEIYNYRALRERLLAGGAHLRTASDTEVILQLFRREGAGLLTKLRGMFAFGIWDAEARSLFLARDPYGIKPLYLANTAKGLMFASQVKALLASGQVGRALDPAGAAGFFLWGSVPEPFTLHREIRPVPPGCHITVTEDGVGEPIVYADLTDALRRSAAAEEGWVEELHTALRDSVAAHMVADVPVAVLLSGGVDSGAVAGIAREHVASLEGFTVAFREFAGDHTNEVPRAALTAQLYGIRHTIRTVENAEFVHDLPRILDAMDQPSIDGVNTWFAAKGVAERGYKVVLSGVGGDELLGGYSTFRTLPQLHALGRFIPRHGPLHSAARAVFGAAAAAFGKPKMAAIADLAGTVEGSYLLLRGLMLPGELQLVLGEACAEAGFERLTAATGVTHWGTMPAAGRTAALESTRYLRNQLLRDSDWASMGHSIELRTPLVDWHLLRAFAPHMASVLRFGGKRLLGGTPQPPLPFGIVEARKTGFGLPMQKWLGSVLAHRIAATPPTLRAPWARQWASIVAEEFGLSLARRPHVQSGARRASDVTQTLVD